MNGLTFFKLKSKYPGDITKNCSLDGTEVDGNFYELEGRDIKTAYWENSTLIIELMNGGFIRVEGITEGCTKDLNIQYDPSKGVLYVTHDGFTETLTGFVTSNVLSNVYSDDTLSGKGTSENPIGISKSYQTGMYRPVMKIIDSTRNEKLPDENRVVAGNRYLTIENVSDYGYLYDYNGVRKIACDLRDSSSEWRIPTKSDWDDLLNSVEPCLEDRNHDKVTSNRDLGRFAGKILKSACFWDLEKTNACDTDYSSQYCSDIIVSDNCGARYSNPCSGYAGEYVECACTSPDPYPNKGIDKYGFSAVPAGYGDDGGHIGYFGERGWYWTATNQCSTNAYAKRFEYNKSTVYQEIISTNNTLSLRLVKDYDGTNYKDCEEILGVNYTTVLMPSLKKGKTIWTSINVAFTNKYYNPVLPNNGMNLTYSKKFFINEWDGNRWIKNEIKNGESVVVLKAPNGNDCVEYRVINGEISNVNDSVYQQVMIEIRPKLDSLQGMIASETIRAKEAERLLDVKIDSETARAVHAENGIIDQLANEISRAQQEEEAINSRIDSIENGHSTDIESLNQKIEAETQRASDAEDVLDAKINSENERAETKENQLDAKINSETERAIFAEMIIQEALDNEIQRAKDAEQVNFNAIQTESETARQNELALQRKIEDEANRASGVEAFIREELNNEINRSIGRDERIETSLNNEINRAEAAEDELSNRIDKIESDNDGHYSDLLEKINSEIERSTNKDEEIELKLNSEIERSTRQDDLIIGRLISKSGSELKANDGILKLVTDDSANNIEIPLDFNFGEI